MLAAKAFPGNPTWRAPSHSPTTHNMIEAQKKGAAGGRTPKSCGEPQTPRDLTSTVPFQIACPILCASFFGLRTRIERNTGTCLYSCSFSPPRIPPRLRPDLPIELTYELPRPESIPPDRNSSNGANAAHRPLSQIREVLLPSPVRSPLPLRSPLPVRSPLPASLGRKNIPEHRFHPPTRPQWALLPPATTPPLPLPASLG
mmetsp:Transcript_10177/g.25505  ORF Transcript_10177/g.25505 Transcript_10177/m.25505 type:complete len:201 (-) Transcript_10177:11-613(-)